MTAPSRPSVLHIVDPELVRLRVLLHALRPDAADPYEPAPEAVVTTLHRMPRAPGDNHGGVPRGVLFGTRRASEAEAVPRGLGDVVRELATLPPDAAAVLRWLQLHGSLASGARGLFCDVGVAFADEAQTAAWADDLGARREGAYLHGRRLVWAAEAAWKR